MLMKMNTPLSAEASVFVPRNAGINKVPELTFLHILGRGGFGLVNLFYNNKTGEKIAVKRLWKAQRHPMDPENPLKLMELSAMESLKHPNLVKFHRFVETPTTYDMHMEYIDAKTIVKISMAQILPSEASAAFLFRQLVEAVAYLHRNSFAHMDIKPDNILVSPTGHLKLIDLGSAARLCGLVKRRGTKNFLPPDAFTHKMVDPVICDSWALGCTLFYILTLHIPFINHNDIHQMYYHLDRPVSKDLWQLISGILEVQTPKRLVVICMQHHPWVKDATCLPIHEWRIYYGI